MDNKEFSKQLEKRTKSFAINIIRELKWADSEKLDILMKEAGEFLAIFTSIGSKLKTNHK